MQPIALFRHQVQQNSVYRQFIEGMGIDCSKVTNIAQIPFLPIECFKRHSIKTGDWQEQLVFTSSGTTADVASRHYIRHPQYYLNNTVAGFEQFYGQLTDWVILALLPSYLERQGSSLVYMLQHFISQAQPHSGFYLYNTQEMIEVLVESQKKGKKVLLWGVTYALLDLAEQYAGLDLGSNVVVLETGGMKGRRREMPREQIHQTLQQAFNLQAIHSEYGMTELLSQAYSVGKGIFSPCATMQVLVRDVTDPLCILPIGKSGGINIIDFANIDSCAFIATDDLGKLNADGTFEILGRLDNSDVRGCNLLV